MALRDGYVDGWEGEVVSGQMPPFQERGKGLMPEKLGEAYLAMRKKDREEQAAKDIDTSEEKPFQKGSDITMSTALVPQVVTESERYMPALMLDQAKQRYNAILEFTRSIMRSGVDFGAVPGTDKPTLLKPGAEKLTSFFGLAVEHPEVLEKDEDWTGERHGGIPFFYYMIRQDLTRNGNLIASQFGSCNSMETKYRWRWVKESDVPKHLDKSTLTIRDGSITEFAFAIDKAETSGPYGKPAEYWQRFKDAIQAGQAQRSQKATRAGKQMDAWTIGSPVYRVPNDSIFDQVNTIQKMAEKRALVAATLLACNASEHFTQDMEDLEFVDVSVGSQFPTHPVATQPASATPHTVTGGATLDDLVGKHNPSPHHPPKPVQTAAGTGQSANTASSPSKTNGGKRTSTPEEARQYVLAKITEARNATDLAAGEALLTKIRDGLPKIKTLTPEARKEIDQAIAEAVNALEIAGTLENQDAEPPTDIYLPALDQLLAVCETVERVEEIASQWETNRGNVSEEIHQKGIENIRLVRSKFSA